MGRPAGGDTDRTRRLILASARECFATHGFDRTTNKMVASHAGVTEGTVYFHYRSKARLYVAAHVGLIAEILEAFQKAVASTATFQDAFDAYVQTALDITHAQPDWPRMLAGVHREVGQNDELAEVFDLSAWSELYDSMTTIGVQTGEIASEDASTVRAVLAATNLGLGELAHASSSAHRNAIDGFSRLVRGTLLGRARES